MTNTRVDAIANSNFMNSQAIKYETPLVGNQVAHSITRGLTSVCTMWGLCSRRLLTVWNTSRMPSAFTLSRTVLSAQKVPVRPAPALYETDAEGEREARVNQSNT